MRRTKGTASTKSKWIWGVLLLALIALNPTVAGAHVQTGRRAVPASRSGDNHSAEASIIGGTEAEPGTFPWMAFVARLGPEAATCSGTVVAANLVLTAAHCVVNLDTGVTYEATSYRVVTGNVDWAQPERQVSGVSRILVYPHFKLSGSQYSGWGDAALLVLSTPTGAPSIPLARHGSVDRLRAGTHAVIAGWGETKYGQEAPTEQLLWARTQVQGDRCVGLPKFHLRSQVCALHRPGLASSACYGDSGGPLLASAPSGAGLIEIGITARLTLGRCQTRGPNIFTRADLISPWVDQWIAALARSSGSKPSVRLLSSAVAEADTREELLNSFGLGFEHRYFYTVGCQIAGHWRSYCGVRWYHHGNDFYGLVTILLTPDGKTPWKARYTIGWVNDHCYFETDHRQRCKVHTRRALVWLAPSARRASAPHGDQPGTTSQPAERKIAQQLAHANVLTAEAFPGAAKG